MKNTKLMLIILWVLVVVFSVAQLANELIALPIFVALNTLAGVAFALIHGAMRYRWSSILAFLAICLVVANIVENTSILTGFLFGHYYYSSALGPKPFNVPLTNYLGWFFTAFVFMLLFALFLRFRKTDHRETWTLPRSYYAQVVVMWAVIGLSYFLAYVPVYLSGSNTPVTDASGTVWQSRDFYQTSAMITIYTILFVAALAAVKLLQGSTDASSTSVEAETHETATKSTL